MPERVIALDPGERTGWAAALMSENKITTIVHGVLPCKELALALSYVQGLSGPVGSGFPPPSGMAPRTAEGLIGPSSAIVYETWRPRPVNGSMNWIQGNGLLSAQLVGQIRLIAWLSDARLVGYGPDRKTVAMASMPGLLRARMDNCPEQHDQDALMHLWMYAFENWVTDPKNVSID